MTQSLSSVAAIFAPALAGAMLTRGWLLEWAWIAALAAACGLVATHWGSGRIGNNPNAPVA